MKKSAGRLGIALRVVGRLRFVDINLRGIGQVMFQDNPLSGALFLAAIAWGSFAAGVPQVLFGGLVAVVAATLTAQWLRVDPASLRAGLYGFNGLLVGLALATFVAPGPLLWAYVDPGRRGVGRRDVGHRPRGQDLGHAGADVPVRARHLAAAARDLRVRGARRHRAARGRAWSRRSSRSRRRGSTPACSCRRRCSAFRRCS